MSENKTRATRASVDEFIQGIENENRRADAVQLLKIMKDVTKLEPRMWGPSIIGFGEVHYKYESGREGDFFQVGFSPRKQNLVLYIVPGFSRYPELLRDLGRHKTGKSCLYLNKLADIDLTVLKKLIKQSTRDAKSLWK